MNGPAPGLVTGLYLVGSVALGDDREGISDIDVVALFPAAPSPEQLDGLARVHAEMAALAPPSFDGIYLTPDRPSRIARTVATGDIVSKTEAGAGPCGPVRRTGGP